MRSLYKDQLPAFDRSMRKTAAFASRLSEEPENWPQELTSDLYKQLPYLSDYDVNVNLDRTDAERGYAFGYADVANKTERPEAEHDEAGLPHLRIPLVVRERQVKPFSIFMDGEKVMPLNEERLREKLFNPSTFDLSVVPPQDPSLVEPLMPPQRSGIGMGGDYKLASADEQLLAMLQGGKPKTAMEKEPAMDVGSPTKEDPRSYWLKKFDDTPFYAQAAALEKEQLKIDLARSQKEIRQIEERAQQKQDDISQREDKLRVRRNQLDLLRQMHALKGSEKVAFVKEAFKHISKEQWDAIYNSMEVQKLMHDYGGQRAHPAVQNKVYELAVKHYGYHPKPEPPPPQKLQEYHQKQQEKQQKASQKQMEKGQKMLQEGQKLVGSGGQKKTAAVKMGTAMEDLETTLRTGKNPSLLMKIASTVRDRDRQAFKAKLASDPTLVASFQRNGMGPLINAFLVTKLATSQERLQAVVDAIDPTVTTIQKLPGGEFLVKQANNDAFVPGQEAQGQVVPPEAGAEMMGDEQAQAMQPGQTVSAVSDPVEDTSAPTQNAVVAETFGEYLTQDLMGNQVMGWVFPETLAWDGSFQPQPVALFTNGSAFAVQDAIAGELIGKNTQLPMSPIRGEGAFYEVTRDGVRVTAPVTVRGGMSGPDGGPMYQAQDFMGNQFSIHLSPELIQPQRISDTEYAIPASWKFMALNNQTQLVPDPVQMNKTGAVKIAAQKVTLFWNGAFNLEGGCGLNKLAKSYRHDLDPVSAEFMLGLLGVAGSDVKEKLAQARKQGSVDLYNLKTITPISEHYQSSVKTASAFLAKVPDLRRDLIKEAAAIEDEATVDKVLALNFVNPENLTTFVEYAPELEQTSEKLAEMLLSSYLGMEEIPEGAVERSMKNMEEILLHLKAIGHAEN